MCKVIADLHNALFFLHSENDKILTIPNITKNAKKPIASCDTIIVFTQHAVDGSVEIYLDIFKEKPNNFIQVFYKNIIFDGEYLCATDPDAMQLCKLTLPKKYSGISIWVNDVNFPSIIKVFIVL